MATIFSSSSDAGTASEKPEDSPTVRLADPLARTLLIGLHGVVERELSAGRRDGEQFWSRHVTQSRRDPSLRVVHEGLERVAAWATLHCREVTWRHVPDLADRWCDLCLRELAACELELRPCGTFPAWTLRACPHCRLRVESAPENFGAVEVCTVALERPRR